MAGSPEKVESHDLGGNLSDRIRNFYDESSSLWEQVWGEHMHHGYYGVDGTSREKDPRIAQRILIEKILLWSQLTSAQQILDVGCGIGGSTLYLASKYYAKATGITLSPRQAARATSRAETAGLDSHVGFVVANALAMPFADNSFDLVWSLESAEHIPDKQQFLAECIRVLRPNGRLIVATWCHRDQTNDHRPLNAMEIRQLYLISRLYHLPSIISPDIYRTLVREMPLKHFKDADWSIAVAPFWRDVMRSMLRPDVAARVGSTGFQTALGALAVPLMMKGFKDGLIRYYLFTAEKSE